MATNPGAWDSGQLPNGNCQGGAPQGWTSGGSQGEPPSSFTTMPYPHQIGGIGKSERLISHWKIHVNKMNFLKDFNFSLRIELFVTFVNCVRFYLV